MIHPTELLRSTSNSENFSAPVIRDKEDIDCGLNVCPQLNRWFNLERFARPAVFIASISILGVFHGIIETYFRGTSKIWCTSYRISSEVADWIIYLNDIIAGMIALAVAYWGNRIHRPNWIGGTTIFLSISAFLLAVPELQGHYSYNNIAERPLCDINYVPKKENLSVNDDFYPIIEYAILFIYQGFMAAASIAFITLGLSYIDDNVSAAHSSIYIGLVVSSREIGRQIGLYCSWSPLVLQIGSVFTSAVWIVIWILLMLVGALVTLFPKVMPNTLIKKSVTSLLNLAAGHPNEAKTEEVDGHCTVVWRIVRNKILMITIVSVTCMQSALVNFGILEKYFNQVKYHVPKNEDMSGYTDIWLVQFTSNLLKQPMIAISMVCAGMIVAKFKPRPKYLVIWNIIVFSIVTILFASTRFWNCAGDLDKQNVMKHKLVIPYCSWKCGCSLDGTFSPVCVNGRTFFSPCLAGCEQWDNELQVYQNCSCSYTKGHASEGSCDAENCKVLLALTQANNIISAGLLASTVVTHLLIIIRSVAKKDKAMALGLLIWFMGHIAFMPVRGLYDGVTKQYCEIYGDENCQFYSPSFAVFVASATVVLMILSVIFGIILLFIIDGLDLYAHNTNLEEDDENYEKRDLENYTTDAEHTEDSVDPSATETRALVHYNNRNNEDRSDEESQLSSLTKTKRERIEKYLSQGDLVPKLPVDTREEHASELEDPESTISENTDEISRINNVNSNRELSSSPRSRNVSPPESPRTNTSYDDEIRPRRNGVIRPHLETTF